MKVLKRLFPNDVRHTAVLYPMNWMKRLMLLVLFYSPCQMMMGQVSKHPTRKELKELHEYQLDLQTRLSAETINGYYIPKDFYDCFRQLDSLLSDKQIQEIRSLPNRRDVEQFDMSVGFWIRNHWGLWEGSRLSQYLSFYKLTAPTFQSDAILQYYYDYLHGDFELRFQRYILNTAYQNHSDTLLQKFFENWSKAYKPDTATTDPYVAEAYKVFYAFFDPLAIDGKGQINSGHYNESQYFVIEPKLRWLCIVDSICLDEDCEEQFAETQPHSFFYRYYKNSVIWDSNVVFFAPIKHKRCLYLTDEYREILDDFFPEGARFSKEELEQKSRADFLNRYVYFYKWSYWEKYHYETDPEVTSITLDVDRKRAYIRFFCLHQHYLGYAYMEKRDGKWTVVRSERDVHVD